MPTIAENDSMPKPLADGCPSWAESLIQRIYLLELEAGNIKKLEDSPWSTTTQEELMKIAGQLEGAMANRNDLNHEVESIFSKIVKGLKSENFSTPQIAAFINARVPTGCNLKYCNPAEVEDALG